MRPSVIGRPPGCKPGKRPDANSATITENRITRSTPSARQSGTVPFAYASVWPPSARRLRWLGVYQCPHCGQGHVALGVSEDDLTGPRRAGCGRRVDLIGITEPAS
jgi:hypothetical protein